MKSASPHRIWDVLKKILVIVAFLIIFTLALSIIFWELYEPAIQAGWVVPDSLQPLVDIVLGILDFYRSILEALVALFYSLPMIGHGG